MSKISPLGKVIEQRPIFKWEVEKEELYCSKEGCELKEGDFIYVSELNFGASDGYPSGVSVFCESHKPNDWSLKYIVVVKRK